MRNSKPVSSGADQRYDDPLDVSNVVPSTKRVANRDL